MPSNADRRRREKQ